MEEYIPQLFSEFVVPGVSGGFIIGFSAYILALGVSFAYKLISTT